MRGVRSAMSILEETGAGTYLRDNVLLLSVTRRIRRLCSFRRGRWVEARGDIDNGGWYAARQVVEGRCRGIWRVWEVSDDVARRECGVPSGEGKGTGAGTGFYVVGNWHRGGLKWGTRNLIGASESAGGCTATVGRQQWAHQQGTR